MRKKVKRSEELCTNDLHLVLTEPLLPTLTNTHSKNQSNQVKTIKKPKINQMFQMPFCNICTFVILTLAKTIFYL